MALPQDGQDANGLTKVTQIPAGKELMFIDPTTNEGGIITLEDLTKQILNGLTSQTFGLDSGTQTLPAAINYLYGNKAQKATYALNDNINDILVSGNYCEIIPVWGNIGGLYPSWAWGIVLTSKNIANFIGVATVSKKLAVAQYSNGAWTKIM